MTGADPQTPARKVHGPVVSLQLFTLILLIVAAVAAGIFAYIRIQQTIENRQAREQIQSQITQTVLDQYGVTVQKYDAKPLTGEVPNISRRALGTSVKVVGYDITIEGQDSNGKPVRCTGHFSESNPSAYEIICAPAGTS